MIYRTRNRRYFYFAKAVSLLEAMTVRDITSSDVTGISGLTGDDKITLIEKMKKLGYIKERIPDVQIGRYLNRMYSITEKGLNWFKLFEQWCSDDGKKDSPN